MRVRLGQVRSGQDRIRAVEMWGGTDVDVTARTGMERRRNFVRISIGSVRPRRKERRQVLYCRWERRFCKSNIMPYKVTHRVIPLFGPVGQ